MSRRNRSCVAIGSVIVGLSLAGSIASARDPNDAMIVSVLHRDNLYIASTHNGLYQASDADKVWRKMPTPISMPGGGNLVQESAGSSRLLYYTGHDLFRPSLDTPGSLFISDDAGKSWTASSINAGQNVLDAFAQPGGSIFVVTETMVTTPFHPGDNSISTTGTDGVTYYPSQHLLLSRDNGHAWKDITPPLRAAFGLFGIFPDPDHPDLVCVLSSQISHTSRTFIYQAEGETYHWKEFGLDEWHGGRDLWGDLAWSPGGGGTNNSNVTATLNNFFKYPFCLSGDFPDLPTKYLLSDKPAYVFHLHQPMPVTITTVFLFPETGIKWLDNKNEKVFWELKIKPEGEKGFLSGPQTAELNFNIPNRDTKIATYLNDPYIITLQVDQAHPYRRVVDLDKVYDFTKPGQYRLQLSHADLYLDHSGSFLSTFAIDVSVLP